MSGVGLNRPVNMHEAKTQLSKLVERVERGEEVVIARRGKPVAKLVPVKERYPVRLGLLKGKIEILPGFDEMDAEIQRDFEEGHPDDPLLKPPEEWKWPKAD
jgi:prevent-host-death family protein